MLRLRSVAGTRDLYEFRCKQARNATSSRCEPPRRTAGVEVRPFERVRQLRRYLEALLGEVRGRVCMYLRAQRLLVHLVPAVEWTGSTGFFVCLPVLVVEGSEKARGLDYTRRKSLVHPWRGND